MRNTAEYREVTVQLEKPVNIMEFNYFYLFTYIYRPQRSCGQGYVFTRVCDSVHRGGLRAGRTHPDRENPPPPGTRHTPPGPGRPPWTRQTPLQTRQTPPQTRQTPGPGRHPPLVRILLECILVNCLILKFSRSGF